MSSTPLIGEYPLLLTLCLDFPSSAIPTLTWLPFHSYNVYPDGSLDNAFPTYHHQPPVEECIGIDPTTVSVRIQTGTGEGPAVGFYVRGMCADSDNHGAFSNIRFDTTVDGGSDCHAVVRDPSNPDTTRVHDIYFTDQTA